MHPLHIHFIKNNLKTNFDAVLARCIEKNSLPTHYVYKRVIYVSCTTNSELFEKKSNYVETKLIRIFIFLILIHSNFKFVHKHNNNNKNNKTIGE